MLRIAVQDEEGNPLSNVDYRLKVSGQIHEGTTDANGLLEQEIRPDAEEGEITVRFNQGGSRQAYTWGLGIGRLDPVEEVSGVQARLNNLAFDSGPVDGIVGEWTRSAVEAFQSEYGLTVDGIAGPRTKAKLREVYGC